jgi:hypothetical protein
MVKTYGISQPQVELLKKWVKTDVYSKGMIKFGKEGKFSLKYSSVNDQGFTDSYLIELTPAEKMSDANSLKATQYKLIDGLRIELYSKEFKAIDIIKLTKGQKKALRLQQLKEDAEKRNAALNNTSVEELEQKAKVETKNKTNSSGESISEIAYNKGVSIVNSITDDAELVKFLKEFLNPSGYYTKNMNPNDYDKLTTYIEQKEATIPKGGKKLIQNEPSQKPKFEVVGNAVVYTEDGSIAEEYNTPEEAKEGLKTWLNVEEKPVKTETKKPVRVFSWDRKHSQGFELSTLATNPLGKKFSALNAKLKDGRTIEEAYQLDIKGYRKVLNELLDKGERYYTATNGKRYDLMDKRSTVMVGKGKLPLNKMTQEESYKAYVNLWMQFAIENPDLIKQLFREAKSRILTDAFAGTDINQARAISDVMNEIINNPSIIEAEKDDFTC